MAKEIDEQIIVVNQPGAGGSLAASATKRADADGRQLLVGTIGSMAIYPILYKSRVDYDPLKDFAPVIWSVSLPLAVVVPASSPFHTLQELTDYLKKDGGNANYASAGNGSSPHLGAELYKSMAGVEAVHVPYNGGSPALLGLSSGETTFMVAVASEAKPFVDAGRLRMLAVTTTERLPDMPDFPTVDESGLPGYEITSWYAFFVRAGTSREIINKYNKALNAALKDEKTIETLTNMGLLIQGGSPEELTRMMETEMVKWQKVVDVAGVSAN